MISEPFILVFKLCLHLKMSGTESYSLSFHCTEHGRRWLMKGPIPFYFISTHITYLPVIIQTLTLLLMPFSACRQKPISVYWQLTEIDVDTYSLLGLRSGIPMEVLGEGLKELTGMATPQDDKLTCNT